MGYVADYGNNRIRKVTPTGVVSTFAGSGSFANVDGTGTAASFFQPYGLSIDGSGNLYVGDYSNHRIRQITPSGVVTTIAGSGASGTSGGGFADGTASSAIFKYPAGVTVSGNSTIYVAEVGNQRVRKVSLSGGYTVSPAIPAGLSLEPATGTISGTPTGFSTATNYTVTATNSSGSSSFTINISVVSSPSISSFTPTNAAAGTTVTITGSNFTGTTAVTFGGVPASSFSVVNNTTISAVVGSGNSGQVTVTNAAGTASLGGLAIPLLHPVSHIVLRSIPFWSVRLLIRSFR